MKSLCLALLCSAFSLSLIGQAGIQFEDSDWETVLAKAKAENKLVFLDAYATWCGPCKMMDKEVFSQAEVGDYYNAKFVNAKIDMEKGEGLALAEKFQIQAYPSLLFVGSDGEMVHQAIGFRDSEGFLALGKEALQPEMQLGTMAKRFSEGERDPAFLEAYAEAAIGAGAPEGPEAAAAYLETQSDWTESMDLVFQAAQTAEGPLFDFIIEHREAYEERYNPAYVGSMIQRMILRTLRPDEGEDALMAQAESLFQKAYPGSAGPLFSNFKMNYFRMAGQNDKYALAAVDYIDNYGADDANELNNTAWSFYELVEDKAMLKKALKWAQRSVALEDAYYNNDSLAALYYKLGQKKKAQKAAAHAIALAKANGENYEGTQELLEQINKL